VIEHEPARTLDKEIVAVHWFTRAELETRRAQHRSPLVLRAIDDYEAGQRYPLELLKATLRD
jgi:hypothetical protein